MLRGRLRLASESGVERVDEPAAAQAERRGAKPGGLEEVPAPDFPKVSGALGLAFFSSCPLVTAQRNTASACPLRLSPRRCWL